MKKVLVISVMALGLTLVSLNKAEAQFYSGDFAVGAIVAVGAIDTPFKSMGAGIRESIQDVTGPSVFDSFGMSFEAGSMFGDMNRAALSMFTTEGEAVKPANNKKSDKPGLKSDKKGDKVAPKSKDKPKKLNALPSPLKKEFGTLNLRTSALGLEDQSASGSTRVWVSSSRKEVKSLGLDSTLSSLAGF